ncbi:MAG: MaoC family dehydratase [Novosphingobium sp.]
MTSPISPQTLAAKVGQAIGTSEWIEVSQDRIDTFAKATDDYQFIHVDPERAKASPFGGTIAHGFLTLSLIAPMIARSDLPQIDGVRMKINYGGNKVRFLAPVKAGKRIRGRFRLLEIEEKRPGQWQQTMEITIDIEGEDKPALIAEWITQIFV